MLAITNTACVQGVIANLVHVEANSGERGDPRIVLVGLPDMAVKESMDRVRSSLTNSGFSPPRTRVTINLAPADLRKEGTSYDLPIAISLLASLRNDMDQDMSKFLLAGELSLSGEVRPVKGAIAMALLAKKLGMSGIILPRKSARIASAVKGVPVYGVETLNQTFDFLCGKISLKPVEDTVLDNCNSFTGNSLLNFAEIKGHEKMRRAVEVAVSGNHNFLMIGPPGSGKSMIAKRVPSILPPPDHSELLEILNILSTVNEHDDLADKISRRPFRSPHHTTSDVGLIGGGTVPGPGEITLAHRGVLFLDELPEFKRSALEVLRQPLEDGQVTISRSAAKITLPCEFMFIAAMNPCPCGYLGSSTGSCRSSMPQVQKYRNRISGPLIDRIDIHIEVPAVKLEELKVRKKGESSENILARVTKCRNIQNVRFRELDINTNSQIPDSLIDDICRIKPSDLNLLENAMKKLNLSARAYNRILKVARTIADLGNSELIESTHLLEAIQYRNLDRKLF